MSKEELRSFCETIRPYQLRVQVRLKDGAEILFGKIKGIETERFELITDDEQVQQVRFSWVARIQNA
jgi:hypothetical protein